MFSDESKFSFWSYRVIEFKDGEFVEKSGKPSLVWAKVPPIGRIKSASVLPSGGIE